MMCCNPNHAQDARLRPANLDLSVSMTALRLHNHGYLSFFIFLTPPPPSQPSLVYPITDIKQRNQYAVKMFCKNL